MSIKNDGHYFCRAGGNRPDGLNEPVTDKMQTADENMQAVEPAIQLLMKRFRPRNLYQVPSEQGFCLPYGFISDDSGKEPHEMGVTYRLIDHPDVTIFFKDLGQSSQSGDDQWTSKGSLKDAVTWM